MTTETQILEQIRDSIVDLKVELVELKTRMAPMEKLQNQVQANKEELVRVKVMFAIIAVVAPLIINWILNRVL